MASVFPPAVRQLLNNVAAFSAVPYTEEQHDRFWGLQRRYIESNIDGTVDDSWIFDSSGKPMYHTVQALEQMGYNVYYTFDPQGGKGNVIIDINGMKLFFENHH